MSESAQTNFHHIIYPSGKYKTQAGERLRQHQLLIVQLPVEAHSKLHAQLPASSSILDFSALVGAYHQVNQLKTEVEPSEVEPSEVVDLLVSWFKRIGQFDLATNLVDQQSFLDQARYQLPQPSRRPRYLG